MTGVPFWTFDGTAHSADAALTSLRRSASLHSRMTLIAAGSPGPVPSSGIRAGRSPGPCGVGLSGAACCGVAACPPAAVAVVVAAARGEQQRAEQHDEGRPQGA